MKVETIDFVLGLMQPLNVSIISEQGVVNQHAITEAQVALGVIKDLLEERARLIENAVSNNIIRDNPENTNPRDNELGASIPS